MWLVCGIIATACMTMQGYCTNTYNRYAAHIFSKKLAHQNHTQHFIFLLD